MNRCPSCRNLVPASWIACRRCGAALAVTRPVALPRAGTITLQRPVVAPARQHAPPRLPPGHDTLLPRGQRDSLLPSSRPRRPARPSIPSIPSLPSRRVALGIAAVLTALAVIVLIFGRTHHGASDTGVATNDPHARSLLVGVTDAAHALFVEHGNYMEVTPAALVRRARTIPVVSASTVARPGQVSARVVGAATFVAATPASGGTCMFARAEPMKARVGFAVTSGVPCRAAAAPAQGWRGT